YRAGLRGQHIASDRPVEDRAPGSDVQETRPTVEGHGRPLRLHRITDGRAGPGDAREETEAERPFARLPATRHLHAGGERRAATGGAGPRRAIEQGRGATA